MVKEEDEVAAAVTGKCPLMMCLNVAVIGKSNLLDDLELKDRKLERWA